MWLNIHSGTQSGNLSMNRMLDLQTNHLATGRPLPSVSGRQNVSLNFVDTDAVDNASTKFVDLNIVEHEDDQISTNDDDDLSSPDDNGTDSEEDIIQGLSNCVLEPKSEDEEYISKGPRIKRKEDKNHSSNGNGSGSNTTESDDSLPGQINSATLEQVSDGIPILPEFDANSRPNFNQLHAPLVDPRLILRTAGGYIVLASQSYLVIHPILHKLGVQLPRIVLPIGVDKNGNHIDLLFQPDPRSTRVIQTKASVQEYVQFGVKRLLIPEQFMVMEPFIYKNKTVIETLLEDVSPNEIESAFKLIDDQDQKSIFKTYGPNHDTLMMTLCCKREDTPTVRAQVFAVATRILREKDLSLRRNLVIKNGSGLSALDYTTVTNSLRISLFLAELLFSLGQNVLCPDPSGNTILHVMARKGDSVSATLNALLSLQFRDSGNSKVFSSRTANAKQLLPAHIASMSDKYPSETFRVLLEDFDEFFHCKTVDGSLPLHLACQYSTDPNMLKTLLNKSNNFGVNERRNDGFTPIHLLAARNEAKDSHIGLFSLDEATQVQMIQVLLDHGADKSLKVEKYRPIDLLRVGRVHTAALIQVPSDQVLEPMEAPLAFDDRAGVMTHPTPPLPQQDSFLHCTAAFNQNMESALSPVHAVPHGFSDNIPGNGDTNGQLEAIAHALISHPTIQAVMDAATEFEPDS